MLCHNQCIKWIEKHLIETFIWNNVHHKPWTPYKHCLCSFTRSVSFTQLYYTNVCLLVIFPLVMQQINIAKWIVKGGSSSDLYPGPLPRIPSKKVVCTTSVSEVYQGKLKLHLSDQEKSLISTDKRCPC